MQITPNNFLPLSSEVLVLLKTLLHWVIWFLHTQYKRLSMWYEPTHNMEDFRSQPASLQLIYGLLITYSGLAVCDIEDSWGNMPHVRNYNTNLWIKLFSPHHTKGRKGKQQFSKSRGGSTEIFQMYFSPEKQNTMNLLIPSVVVIISWFLPSSFAFISTLLPLEK